MEALLAETIDFWFPLTAFRISPSGGQIIFDRNRRDLSIFTVEKFALDYE
jgi:hypothetical protein